MAQQQATDWKAKECRGQWNTNVNAIRISQPDLPEKERWEQAKRQVDQGFIYYSDEEPDKNKDEWTGLDIIET